MGITAITIENFKGIREPVRVELKPVTLLFGPNSAGKSTIVQALHYAREIFERQNTNPDKTLLGGDSMDLGGFESLVYGHDLGRPIKLRFDLDLSNEDLPRYLEGYEQLGSRQWEESDLWEIPHRASTAWVEILVRWSGMRERPLVTSYQVGINGEELAVIETTDDGNQVFLNRLDTLNPVFYSVSSPADSLIGEVKKRKGIDLNENEEKARNELGLIHDYLDEILATHSGGSPVIWDNIALARQYSALPDWGVNLNFGPGVLKERNDIEEEGRLVQILSSLITGPGELVRDWLRKLCYIGPLREVPKRGHRPVTSPDESRWANGLAAYDTLFFSNDAFIGKVNDWLTLEERLNTGYSVKVKRYRELETSHHITQAMLQDRILDEDVNLGDFLNSLPEKQRLLIRDEARDIELEPQDIGVGISQVLPVVVAALHRKSGLVAIEQPELHIHPAFQVALGDLFIEQIHARQDLTFLLETHSEHLMLRFLRRIRETGENEAPENRTLTPAELSINFIEQKDGGISCISIGVDEEGDFTAPWPKGFFNERVKELY